MRAIDVDFARVRGGRQKTFNAPLPTPQRATDVMLSYHWDEDGYWYWRNIAHAAVHASEKVNPNIRLERTGTFVNEYIQGGLYSTHVLGVKAP